MNALYTVARVVRYVEADSLEQALEIAKREAVVDQHPGGFVVVGRDGMHAFEVSVATRDQS